jgi:transcriptional regulator with XRE-family HTH domain
MFGLKLSRLRAEAGLSLKGLSKKVGMSASYLNEIERGKKHPKPEKIQALALALGVDYDNLVSQKLDKSQRHVERLLKSAALQKIPFHLFGLSLEDVVSLIPRARNEGQALVSALVEVCQNYDLRVEDFFHIALRCYQEMNKNYFPEVEEAVLQYRERRGWVAVPGPGLSDVIEALQEDFQVEYDEEFLSSTEYMRRLRSALVDRGGGEVLAVNEQYSETQRVFLVLREIGYRVLGLKDRGRCSPDIEDQTFEHIKNSFLASYFATAMLIDGETLAADMRTFYQNTEWRPDEFIALMHRHRATEEMFFYRLSEVLPHYLGLEELHFLRFDLDVHTGKVNLIKQLNMSSVVVPTGLALQESFCGRWMSIKVLQRLAASGGALEVGTQHSQAIGKKSDEFFCISLARPLTLTQGRLSSVTVGVKYDPSLEKLIRFIDSPGVEKELIGGTCERCSLLPEECQLRQAPASLFERDMLRRNQRKELLSIID